MKVQEKSTGVAAEKPNTVPLPLSIDAEAIDNLDKLARAKQAEIILNRIEEITKEVQDEQEEEESSLQNSSDTRKDTASLSNESRIYNMTPKQLEELLKIWDEKEQKKAWMPLLQWFPLGSHSMKEDIVTLTAVYQKLLQAILSNTFGEELQNQLSRLEHMLFERLNQLLDVHLPELTHFLEDYATRESVSAMRASVYQMVTGDILPSKEMERLWKPSEHRPGNAAGLERREQGVLYQPSGKGHVFTDPKYTRQVESDRFMSLYDKNQKMIQRGDWKNLHENMQNFNNMKENQAKIEREEMPHSLHQQNYQKGQLSGRKESPHTDTSQAQFSARVEVPSEVYTPKDLQTAQTFVKYVKGQGNLFFHPAITAQNEEIIGVISALMSLKAQIFADFSGVNRSLGLKIGNAVEKMIDFYIGQYGRGGACMKEHGMVVHERTAPIRPKEVYKIYYYILNLYQKTRKPNEAIWKGLDYAGKLFEAKREEGKPLNMPQYEKDSGFFTAVSQEHKRKPEWKEGQKTLDRDWKQFLQTIDQEHTKELELNMMKYSLWGMLEEPEKQNPALLPKSPLRMLGVILITAVFVILVLYFIL